MDGDNGRFVSGLCLLAHVGEVLGWEVTITAVVITAEIREWIGLVTAVGVLGLTSDIGGILDHCLARAIAGLGEEGVGLGLEQANGFPVNHTVQAEVDAWLAGIPRGLGIGTGTQGADIEVL